VGGEKSVIRILDVGSLALNLDAMGWEPQSLAHVREAIAQPYGMMLVTGPTGSGKSTTLYSCVQAVATSDVNVTTVEDPVEYRMEGINQVPVNPKRGITFAGALRSILRQDPDIVLVGEVRDKETADIAVKAALTGHLVLSTLHTNDAASTITRLVDMGVVPVVDLRATARTPALQKLPSARGRSAQGPLDQYWLLARRLR
jgi:type IV pilus assembly protein PilB